jgi:proteasome lid subunit RPN8/RPN11
LTIPSGLLQVLSEEARSSGREICGFLLGLGQSLESRAGATVGQVGAYRLEPGALLQAERDARAKGQQILGVYHSHPSGGLGPSWLDHANAVEGWHYLVLGSEPRLYFREHQRFVPALMEAC